MIPEVIANMILQIVLIATLNIVMYFTYTTTIERRIVEAETTRIVQDFTNDIRTVLPNDSLAYLDQKISPYLVVPDLSKEDNDVETANKQLVKQTIKILSISVLSGLIFVVAMSIIFKFSLKNMFLHNMGVLFVVAIVEIVFLTFFVQYYISVDINFVKRTIIDTLQRYVNEHTK